MILPGASTTLKSTCHSLDKYKAKVSPEAKLRHPVAAACAGWCRRQTANAPRVHTHTQRQAHITRTHTHTLTPANMDARTDNHGDTHTHIYIFTPMHVGFSDTSRFAHFCASMFRGHSDIYLRAHRTSDASRYCSVHIKGLFMARASKACLMLCVWHELAPCGM